MNNGPCIVYKTYNPVFLLPSGDDLSPSFGTLQSNNHTRHEYCVYVCVRACAFVHVRVLPTMHIDV